MPSLTQREQDLLYRYRRFYLRLVEGRRLPETNAQRCFLEVAAGRLPPMTKHERLWVMATDDPRQECSGSQAADGAGRALELLNGNEPPRDSSPWLIYAASGFQPLRGVGSLPAYPATSFPKDTTGPENSMRGMRHDEETIRQARL